MIRVGLIGAGMISAHHLAAWSKLTSAQVVAIADPSVERAAAQAARFTIERVYASAEEMIATAALDAVDIAAPVAHHASLCRLSANAGLHILCQKPLAQTADEARRLLTDIAGRVRLMVHENWRFRPTYQTLHRWMTTGRIGEVGEVRLVVSSSGLVPGPNGLAPALERQPFLAELPRLIVFELLTHHFDVLCWLFGDLELQDARLSRTSSLVRGEDGAELTFRAASGAEIRVSASFSVPGAPTFVRDVMVIEGDRSVARIDGGVVSLSGASELSASWPQDALYQAAFDAAMRTFVDHVTAGSPLPCEPTENLRVLELVERTYQKAGTAREPW